MIGRYKDIGNIFGQFLPKIYTRRIILESSNELTRVNRGEDPSNGMADLANIKVEAQIRDVLDENGIGIITQNQHADRHGGQHHLVNEITAWGNQHVQDAQRDIVQATRVIMVLGDSKYIYDFSEILGKLAPGSENFSRHGLEEETSFVGMVRHFLENARRRSLSNRRDDFYLDYVMLPALDATHGSSYYGLENSLYHRLDANNNIIRVHPLTYEFNLLDTEMKNLSLLTFSFFDFRSLAGYNQDFDHIQNEELLELGYMMGDMTLDTILDRDGNVSPWSAHYFYSKSGAPYVGPVHKMPAESGHRHMTGRTHTNESVLLDLKYVPQTKVQDFRSMKRAQPTLYTPDNLPSFIDHTLKDDFVTKKHRNHFKTTGVVVDLDREIRETNIKFTVDMHNIFRLCSRYVDIIDSLPDREQQDVIENFPIIDIKVLRRRVTNRPIGHNTLGFPARKVFDTNEEVHVVAQSRDVSDHFGDRRLIPRDSEVGYLADHAPPGEPPVLLPYRAFVAKDKQISEIIDSGGVYQYGVEITVADKTKAFFQNIIEFARMKMKEMEKYYEEATMPVFDRNYLDPKDASYPMPLGGDLPDPTRGSPALPHGNYDRKTNTFTPEFNAHVRDRYDIRSWVAIYFYMIRMSLGINSINLTSTKFSDPGESGVGYNLIDVISETTNFNLDLPAHRRIERLIEPKNSRPEQIAEFISSFRSLMLHIEKFFEFPNLDETGHLGGRVTSKTDSYHHTIRRWFSFVDGVESDNYVDLSVPVPPRINYIHDPVAASPFGFPTANLNDLQTDVIAWGDNYAAVLPTGMNIGDTVVHFDGDLGGFSLDNNDEFHIHPESSEARVLESFVFGLADHFLRAGDGTFGNGAVERLDAVDRDSFFNVVAAFAGEIRDDSVSFEGENRPQITLNEAEGENSGNDCGLSDNRNLYIPRAHPDITDLYLGEETDLNNIATSLLLPRDVMFARVPDYTDPATGLFPRSRLMTAGVRVLASANQSTAQPMTLLGDFARPVTVDDVTTGRITGEIRMLPASSVYESDPEKRKIVKSSGPKVSSGGSNPNTTGTSAISLRTPATHTPEPRVSSFYINRPSEAGSTAMGQSVLATVDAAPTQPLTLLGSAGTATSDSGASVEESPTQPLELLSY